MRLNWFTGKMDVRFLGVYFTAVFSGAYLTRLGFSPIYPLMGLGFLLLTLTIAAGRVRLPLAFWGATAFTVLVLLLFSVHQTEQGSLFQNALNFTLGPVGFLLISTAGRRLSKDGLEKVARHLVYFTIILTAIECVYRLTHPDYSFLEDAEERQIDVADIAFYAYKFSSLMYLDSNFVGLQVAIVFAFALALIRFDIRFSRSVYITLFLITCATLSRASVIAFLAAVGFYIYPRLSFTFRAIGLVMGFIGIQVVFLLVQTDGSFATKIALLQQLSEYLSTVSTSNLLLGVGAGRAIDYLGMGAHNLAVVYTVEAGLLLSALVAVFWLYVFKSAKGAGLIIAVWLINGFSLTSFAMPYMYCAAAILWCLDRRKRQVPEQNASPYTTKTAPIISL
jgi:hypothetical protein